MEGIVALFGGQGSLYADGLAALYANKSNRNVQNFLEQCCSAMQDEFNAIPPSHKYLLPEGSTFVP